MIGAGYVGLTLASVLAKFGNKVSLVENDSAKLRGIRKGKPHFYEPGLGALLRRVLANGSLTLFGEASQLERNLDVIFIAVGTPSKKSGAVNLSAIWVVAREISSKITPGQTVVVLKSTSTPGTTRRLAEKVNSDIAFCPEFLREGHALEDTLHPDRIIIGCERPKTAAILKRLFTDFKVPMLTMKIESAELTKYAANSYLALRIVFANQLADLVQKAGADIKEVISGIGLDRRIGSHYWYPGLGYGGSCFPKDVAALAVWARKVGVKRSLFRKMDSLNRQRAGEKLAELEEVWGSFQGKRVAVWGLACKQGTDDIRGSRAMEIIKILCERKVKVTAFDYLAMEKAKNVLPSIDYKDDPYKAVKGADVLLVLTDEPKFSKLSFERVKTLMRSNKVFDARNILNRKILIKLGFQYRGVGR